MADTPSPAPHFDPTASMVTVRYEYQMATAMCACLLTPASKVQQFGYLESFLVHIRNLDEFFRPRTAEDRKEREDPRRVAKHGSVWACDYVEGFGTKVLSEEWRKKVNRHLQHVTTWRQQPPNPKWQCKNHLRAVYQVMADFIPALVPEHRQHLTGAHRDAERLLTGQR